ncbi:nucleoside diphosphate kinase regulator [Sedimentitalea arenosa]|uniref:Nucleoside diphosphate kinase regulator n=1 Tax=Sedimentitalea arenosa TaxID=2798803 RepID=A0A8J7LT28_9RHOB|nr:nucleoside diphosphate kinase regulator [Arenibacterium arenosum]MBJ6373498.1 nucleoside diphosphate kinase regulator [Arenibacterium arenosum]
MTEMTRSVAKRNPRAPKITINADDLAHIEALAEGAMQRNPALADRLLEEIGRARIVAPGKMPANVVSIGSIVTYRDETTGVERTVTLTYPEDADIAQQRVSVVTPIGVALLGLPEGAVFHWDTRTDQRRMLKVLRVQAPVGRGDG